MDSKKDKNKKLNKKVDDLDDLDLENLDDEELDDLTDEELEELDNLDDEELDDLTDEELEELDNLDDEDLEDLTDEELEELDNLDDKDLEDLTDEELEELDNLDDKLLEENDNKDDDLLEDDSADDVLELDDDDALEDDLEDDVLKLDDDDALEEDSEDDVLELDDDDVLEEDSKDDVLELDDDDVLEEDSEDDVLELDDDALEDDSEDDVLELDDDDILEDDSADDVLELDDDDALEDDSEDDVLELDDDDDALEDDSEDDVLELDDDTLEDDSTDDVLELDDDDALEDDSEDDVLELDDDDALEDSADDVLELDDDTLEDDSTDDVLELDDDALEDDSADDVLELDDDDTLEDDSTDDVLELDDDDALEEDSADDVLELDDDDTLEEDSVDDVLELDDDDALEEDSADDVLELDDDDTLEEDSVDDVLELDDDDALEDDSADDVLESDDDVLEEDTTDDVNDDNDEEFVEIIEDEKEKIAKEKESREKNIKVINKSKEDVKEEKTKKSDVDQNKDEVDEAIDEESDEDIDEESDEFDEIPEDIDEPEIEMDPDQKKLEALKKLAEMTEENKPKPKEGDEYNSKESMYPDELIDLELECLYVGLLFNNPKAMSRYYLKYEDCRFSEDELANLYKIVLFRDGEQYAPAIAKDKYQLPRENPNTYDLKLKVRRMAAAKAKDVSLEKVYRDVKKLFILKKNYVSAATTMIQDEILGILKYELYDEMTVEEVESALEQITVTAGLSQGRLNDDATSFLLAGDNELSNGISIPFEILSTVFKGLRKGETMTYAMPSNSGKSRFTINLAAYISFIHKEKVLIISNEMSAEKMKLCMITTIINNPEIQKIHGQNLHITEGELLELKFRPDKGKRVKCDENGYILRKPKEDQEEYVERLKKNSSDFRSVLKVTDWVDTQVDNSIFFIHITEHTNDDLRKIIMNYYYKEGIHYMFYDTLKADTANIGNSDEVKKTATILSNLAQKFHIFIGSSMQLLESSTLPVNLTINDMSASKTVKEVLDTLMLIKQISRASLHKYEYADTDQFEKCHDIEVPKDTDVRFYACVVDKNRAGAKPTVLFKLNLAYNRWVELGHLRLKQENIEED